VTNKYDADRNSEGDNCGLIYRAVKHSPGEISGVPSGI
jgi:hypothetical protein